MAWAWLRSGNDRALAATDYPTRESATARRERRDRERQERTAARRRRDHHRHATSADRDGQRWETNDRRHYGG